MTFKESLKCFYDYKKFIFPTKLSLCRVDLLIRAMCINEKQEVKKLHFSSKIYIVHLFLSIYSIFTILKVKFLSIKQAHYLIDIKNSQNYYDNRSQWILDILPPHKTVNFMHFNDIHYSLLTLFKKQNIIYFESLYYVLSPFLKRKHYSYTITDSIFINKIADNNQEYYNSSYYIYKINKLIIEFLNLEQFIMLDDTRYTNELKLICEELNIKTVGYMHARFNQYHLGIFEFPFDTYLVWSEYFKDKLLEHKSYKEKKVFVVGSPKIQKKYDFLVAKNKKRILWLDESTVKYEEVYPYIKILQENGYEVIFRTKPGKNVQVDKKLKKLDITRDKSKSYFHSLAENNIGIVIATYSTTLMESWLVGIPSVIMKTNNDYPSHLWEDGLINLATQDDIIKIIELNLNLKLNEIEKRRDKIWGSNYMYNERLVKEILLDRC